MRVLVSQRIIPHYRVPLFEQLSRKLGDDFLVVYGEGMKIGSQKNGENLNNINRIKSRTCFLNYSGIYGTKQLRPVHLDLWKVIWKYNPDVVIVEPSTNLYNNLIIFFVRNFLSFDIVWHESGRLPKKSRSLYRRMVDPIISLMIRSSSAYLTYTSYADYSLVRDFGIAKSRIFRAQNTLDVASLRESYLNEEANILLEKTSRFGNDPVFLYIGSIEKRKKISWLIESARNYNGKVQVMIVGDGDYLSELEHISQGMDNVHFYGKITNDTHKIIGLSDVVCLPALGGLSVLDAMACSKAFLGSRLIENGGIKDYVQDGVTGMLCDENFDSFFSAFCALSDNLNKTREMGKSALQYSYNFDIDRMAESFLAASRFVYDERTNIY